MPERGARPAGFLAVDNAANVGEVRMYCPACKKVIYEDVSNCPGCGGSVEAGTGPASAVGLAPGLPVGVWFVALFWLVASVIGIYDFARAVGAVTKGAGGIGAALTAILHSPMTFGFLLFFGVILPLAYVFLGVQLLRLRTRSLQGPAWLAIGLVVFSGVLVLLDRLSHGALGLTGLSSAWIPAAVAWLLSGVIALWTERAYARFQEYRVAGTIDGERVAAAAGGSPAPAPVAAPVLIAQADLPPPSSPEMRRCPYCAEEVRIEAIKCRHCRSMLPASPPVPGVSAVAAAPPLAPTLHADAPSTPPDLTSQAVGLDASPAHGSAAAESTSRSESVATSGAVPGADRPVTSSGRPTRRRVVVIAAAAAAAVLLAGAIFLIIRKKGDATDWVSVGADHLAGQKPSGPPVGVVREPHFEGDYCQEATTEPGMGQLHFLYEWLAGDGGRVMAASDTATRMARSSLAEAGQEAGSLRLLNSSAGGEFQLKGGGASWSEEMRMEHLSLLDGPRGRVNLRTIAVSSDTYNCDLSDADFLPGMRRTCTRREHLTATVTSPAATRQEWNRTRRITTRYVRDDAYKVAGSLIPVAVLEWVDDQGGAGACFFSPRLGRCAWEGSREKDVFGEWSETETWVTALATGGMACGEVRSEWQDHVAAWEAEVDFGYEGDVEMGDEEWEVPDTVEAEMAARGADPCDELRQMLQRVHPAAACVPRIETTVDWLKADPGCLAALKDTECTKATAADILADCDSAAAAGAGAGPAATMAARPSIVSIRASSSMDRYEAVKAMDGNSLTAWGIRGSPVGEWLEVEVAPPAIVRQISMQTGFVKTASNGLDVFTANRRLHDVHLVATYGDGRVFEADHAFADDRAWQTVPVPGPTNTALRSLRVVIKSTFEGSRWQDTHVSEIRVGLQGGASSAGVAQGAQVEALEQQIAAARASAAEMAELQRQVQEAQAERERLAGPETGRGPRPQARRRQCVNQGTAIEECFMCPGDSRCTVD